MSEPFLVTTSKRHRNASFSIRSENASTIDEEEKSARKFFTTWRSACDRTKVKTKELLKRTLSWKGVDYQLNETSEMKEEPKKNSNSWSVHVWTTWVRRSSLYEECENVTPMTLSKIQREKLTHFFHVLLDLDRDDLISMEDFDQFSNKLRHFADWSLSSMEFSRLKQVQQELAKTFFANVEVSDYLVKGYMELNDWLYTWNTLLKNIHRINELPFWLQQFPKVLFLIINRSETGVITKEELRIFFISVIGSRNFSVEDLTEMYNAMTANGDFRLTYSVYELCFANWLLCKNPNGPGQWLFGKCGTRYDFFPIDYSAMMVPPEDRETYTIDGKSNRHSIIV